LVKDQEGEGKRKKRRGFSRRAILNKIARNNNKGERRVQK